MIFAIKSAFISKLPSVTWLDIQTRERAIKKVRSNICKVFLILFNQVQSLRSKIGFKNDILDPSKMTEKYANLIFTDSDYFENIKRYSEWNSRDKLNRFQKAVDRESWEMSPQTVNAYYVCIL